MLKKRLLSLALAMLLVGITPGAQAWVSGFTHPEIGELLTVKFDNGMPMFSIYDFPYYVVADPAQPLRGIKANFTEVPNKNMLNADAALGMFFDSLTAPKYAIYRLVYVGVNADYTEALSNLPEKERIEAIQLLNGFGGAGGYAALTGFKGFEDTDVSALAASHMDYHVKIGNSVYPYRVLSFHFEGDDWVSFTERYAFLQVDGEWKLSRAVTEYTDDYLFRGKYIHGISGSAPEAIEETNAPLLRGATWGMTEKEVSALERVKPADGGVVVNDIVAFRIPATLHYEIGRAHV